MILAEKPVMLIFWSANLVETVPRLGKEIRGWGDGTAFGHGALAWGEGAGERGVGADG